MEKWYVCILGCKDESLYTGVTRNIKRRLQEHKEGRGGRYTRLSKVDNIVYYEIYATQEKALKREKQIKGWCRKKKEILIQHRDSIAPA